MLRRRQATVTVEDTVTFPFTCRKCQHYCYAQVRAVGEGTGSQAYVFDGDDAGRAAASDAQDVAQRDLERDGQIVIGLAPCPACRRAGGTEAFQAKLGVQGLVALASLGGILYVALTVDLSWVIVAFAGGAWLYFVITTIQRATSRLARAKSVYFYSAD